MDEPLIRVEAGPMVAGGTSLVRRPDQKVMFVDGALPGEVVDVRITGERKQMLNARVTQVINASPDRAEATCPLFTHDCGGCQWNYITPAAQHELKTDIVRDALVRIAKLDEFDLKFHAGVSANAYRTTMRMALRDGRPGMRRRQSHEVLAPVPCTITHSLLHPLITEGRYEGGEVTLRASISTGETAVVTDRYDDSIITENVGGHDFVISAQSFFQSGPEAASLLSELVDSFVATDANWIVDAYTGIGVLGAGLARKRNSRLTAIESNPFACADARQNLALFDAQVLESEVSEVELLSGSPDVIVADPSRSGLGKSATKALAQLQAPTFVLVSCDPASMARDVVLLEDYGYNLGPVRVLDLFPQTPHVETVAVLSLN